VISISDDEIKNWDGSEAIKGVNFQGIYVDPRYTPSPACRRGVDVEQCKFDAEADPAFPLKVVATKTKHFDSANNVPDGRKDDALGLECAKKIVAIDPELVLGNHVEDDKLAVVHYAKEGETPEAYSLGDWGPVTVNTQGGAPGARRGAPVFTIETHQNHESFAFDDGVHVVNDKGKPIPPRKTLKVRVRNQTPRGELPAKFQQERSEQLQAYAQGIIDVLLDT
jgi:hypothetical protein